MRMLLAGSRPWWSRVRSSGRAGVVVVVDLAMVLGGATFVPPAHAGATNIPPANAAARHQYPHAVWSPAQTPLPRTRSVAGVSAGAPGSVRHAPMPGWRAQTVAWPAGGSADVVVGTTLLPSAVKLVGSLAGKTQ